MTEKEIYRAAIEKYGDNHQMMMCIEEMSELTKELCKNIRGRNNKEQIAEEIADVQIMLEQMKILFDCETVVCFWTDEKLQRLKKIMENKKRKENDICGVTKSPCSKCNPGPCESRLKNRKL